MGEPIDQTPDPNAKATLTEAQGAVIGSGTAAGAATASTTFDPTSITIITGNGEQQSFDGSANSAMSPAAPATENAGKINLKVARRDIKDIQTNVLDAYIDAGYHISLAIVSYDAVKTLRQDTVQKAQLSPSQYIVFASTAETASNSDLVYNYYNIQGFSFVSFLGHTQQNPMVSVIWDGKMRIYEPYGFALRENLDDLAISLGYPQTSSANEFIFRFEIWFSGYDPDSGVFTEQIDIPCPRPESSGNKVKSIIYYCTISAVEGKVTGIGTMYDLSMQVFSYGATRAESVIAHQDSVFKGGIQANSGSTFRNFLQELANKMRTQVLNDTQKEFDITYQFVGLKQLFSATFVQDTKINLSTSTTTNPGQGSYATTGRSMDLYTIIYNVMLNLDFYQQQLLQENDKGFVEPTVHWNIRTNIFETEGGSSFINTNTRLTYQYIIEPVLTFRNRQTENKDFNKQIEPGNQNSRINKMFDFGMIQRVYNYYFTSGNTEVIDFDIHLKTFFYAPIYYKAVNTIREQDHETADLSKQRDKTLFQYGAEGSQQSGDVVTPNLFGILQASGQDVATQLGISSAPAGGSASRPANVHQYMGRAPDVMHSSGDASGQATTSKARTARQYHLQNDMIRAKMKVRFDPIWLLNPYMSGTDVSPVAAEDQREKGVFVYVHVDRIIFINVNAPNQKSFMNPDLSSYSSNHTAILGGFYQVISAKNDFEAGQFTQTLDLLKLPHLNYNKTNPAEPGSGSTTTSNTGLGSTGADPAAGKTLG